MRPVTGRAEQVRAQCLPTMIRAREWKVKPGTDAKLRGVGKGQYQTRNLVSRPVNSAA